MDVIKRRLNDAGYNLLSHLLVECGMIMVDVEVGILSSKQQSYELVG